MSVVRTSLPVFVALFLCSAGAIADERPSAVSLHQSLLEAEVEVQTNMRRDVQNILVNGTGLPFFQFVDVRAVLTPQETAALRRMILSDPEAADIQTKLSNLLRAFGFLEVKEFVVGVDGTTIFFITDRAVR